MWSMFANADAEYFGPPSFNFEVNSNGKFATEQKIEQPSNMNTTRGAAGPPPRLESMIYSGVWWCRVTSRVR